MQFQEQVITKDYIHMIKRKRTKRQRIASIYPRLALTMVTSSSITVGVDGGGDGVGGTVMSTDVSGSSDCMTLTPSNSSYSGEFTQSITDEVEEEEEEEDMANCLILLAKGSSQMSSSSQPLNQATVNKTEPLTVAHVEVNYQCKTCNKSFSSFQALGGHRASHKRSPIIKPMFTSTEDKKPLADFKEGNFPSNNDGSTSTTNIVSLKITSSGLSLGSQVPQNKSRIHECAICGAEFASGQALGGHMRRHRQQLPAAAISSNKNKSQEAAKKPKNILSLDLNLPAPEVDDGREYSNLPFAPKEQVIVFSSPAPLVDCHY